MKVLNKKSVIFIVAGIICIILLIITGGKEKEVVVDNSIDYELRAEEKLTELISGLGGVSNVRVMVTLECGTEYVYAVNKDKTAEAERTEYYSAGEKEALLIKEKAPVVKGVAVVCDSTDKNAAKRKITELVSSVLDVSVTRIFVDT